MSEMMMSMQDNFLPDTAMSHRYFGKYRGTVLKNKPPEGRPQAGMLLVQVAELSEGGEGDQPGKPIEVWAMPCFHPGFCVVPQVDAKVWVEFVAGNINDPIWSGAWYPQSGEEQVPVVEVDNRGGSSRLLIKHRSGARIEISEDGNIVLLDSGKNFVSISKDEPTITIHDGAHQAVMTMGEQGIILAFPDNFIQMNKDGIVISSATQVRLQGKNVFLGASEAGYESVIMGETFAKAYDAHMHAHPMGPTGPPIPTTGPVLNSLLQLSSCVKVAKSL